MQSSALITVSNVSRWLMHNLKQEILRRFSFFSYQLPAVHGDDVIMPPAIIVFPRARYNYYILLYDYYCMSNLIGLFMGNILPYCTVSYCTLFNWHLQEARALHVPQLIGWFT